jgi:DNA-binding response OmpR family regulator
MENKKILLVVEDEEAMLSALNEKLSAAGFKVFEARNGEEGIKEALEIKPDAIVLDIVMPKMNGMEVLAKLREDAWGKSVPVVILTNLGADESISAKVAATEPAYYLMKMDYSLADIVEKVKSLFTS